MRGTRFHACGAKADHEPVGASVTLESGALGRVRGDGAEGTDHGAHEATLAAVLEDDDRAGRRVPGHRAVGARRDARGVATVQAADGIRVGESRLDVHPLLRDRTLEHRAEECLCSGVLHRARNLTRLARRTAFDIDEDLFHPAIRLPSFSMFLPENKPSTRCDPAKLRTPAIVTL